MNDKTLQAMINAEDTHPWYRARLRLVEIWASKLLPQCIGVDIGCGSGAAAQLLQERFSLDVTGYDIAPYAVDASLKRGVRTIQADVTSLQIAGGSQDFVVSLDVIEHIEDRFVLLNEINRILKPGGTALITVPAHMWLWSNHDVLNHHFRRYSKDKLISDIQQSGFEISSIRWWNSIFLPYIFLTRLISKKNYESSEFEAPPRLLNSIVYRILNFESKSRFTGFLVGVSLVAEIRKV